jgi:hypothetical protein
MTSSAKRSAYFMFIVIYRFHEVGREERELIGNICAGLGASSISDPRLGNGEQRLEIEMKPHEQMVQLVSEWVEGLVAALNNQINELIK